ARRVDPPRRAQPARGAPARVAARRALHHARPRHGPPLQRRDHGAQPRHGRRARPRRRRHPASEGRVHAHAARRLARSRPLLLPHRRRPAMRFFVPRAVFYLFTAWAAITLNFFLPRMLKGDPVTAYINKNQGLISPDQIDALRVLFGLDTDLNLWQQYIEYWKLLFQGDLGRSFSNGLAPVTDVIGGALP